MAKVRKLESFDEVFQRATEAALRFHAAGTGADDGEALIRIPCLTVGKAINVQMQFRQYWQALDRALRAGEIGSNDPRRSVAEGSRELATRAMQKDKTSVEILHRSNLAVSRAVGDTLAGLQAAMDKLPHLAQVSSVPVAPALSPATLSAAEARATGKDPQEQAIAEAYGVGGKPA